jgi:hypothetical protein
MTKREKILEVAAAEKGTKESPVGSNKQKYGAWYGLNGVPWCAIFVSWVFSTAGVPLGYIDRLKGFQDCRSAYNYWKNSGELTNHPEPGDIVLYNWGKGKDHDNKMADHVGIFVGWKEGHPDRLLVWEGNTSTGNDSDGGEVMLRDRSITFVHAFVKPKVLLS